MFSRRFPELSATCGQRDDGIPLGVVDDSLLVASLSNVKVEADWVIRRKNRKPTGGAGFEPVATIDGSTAVEVFGPLSELSDGDGAIIACDCIPAAVYFDIEGGVGTWTLKVYESTDGKQFSSTPLAVTDETNAFRTTGVKRIVIPAASNPKLFSPMYGEVPEEKWYLYELSGYHGICNGGGCR